MEGPMTTDLVETEEGLLLAVASAGDIKTIPKKNTSQACQSCGTQIDQIYCGQCGQKNDDLRRSLWRLISESLGGIFSFESRMWRTWGALLLKPGKVAYEYANGARSRYSPPIRVYLVVSFLFFAFIAFSNTNFLSFEVIPKQTEQSTAQGNPADDQNSVDAENTISDDFLDGFSHTRTRSLSLDYKFGLYLFAKNDKLYKMTNQEMEEFARIIQEDEDVSVQIKNKDVDTKGFLSTLLTNQQKLNGAFNTWLPRAMFFMVPFAMIFGWLFIRGKNALLYDHLIHAIYIHCIFYLALIIALLLSRIVPGGIVFLGLFVFMLIHIIVSTKTMFSRGWIKTVWTALGTGFLYSLLLFFIMFGISVYSIIQAATDAGLVT
ncbi:MAG: hypothetical protein COA91_03035 [Robiginitomaculum sp.]|nr:MAG: hypothetical protein COA91_03035 [Robiginitomaculum sp.]